MAATASPAGSAPRPSLATDIAALIAASNRWDVPASILLGVFGRETNFGRYVKTSSAGAEGETQFIPTTAVEYGYPLTNTPTIAQVAQQFDATAQKLAHDAGPTKDWAQAITAYGGGYSLADVQNTAAQALGAGGIASAYANDIKGAKNSGISQSGILGGIGGIAGGVVSGIGSAAGDVGSAAGSVGSGIGNAFGDVGSAVGGVASGISDVGTALGDIGTFFSDLTNPSFWLRILEFLAGLLLLFLGLRQLASVGAGNNNVRSIPVPV